MSNLQWELSDADEPGVADLSLPLAGDLNRSLLRGQAPPALLRASVREPGRFADLLGLGWATLHAVSPKFASAIEGLAGVVLTPIEIKGGPRGYSVLGASGRCGLVDYSRSVEVQRFGRFVRRRGIYVDAMTDEVDFAVPENRESILISTRAADLIRAAKLDNVEIVALAEAGFII